MGLSVTILQLETFQAVVDTGSTVEAASKLYTSQSSVSKTLSRLEENLGFPLFARQRGKIALTESGQYFYECTNRILKDLNQSIRGGYKLHQTSRQSLRIAGSTYLLRNLVQNFLGEHERSEINILFYPEKLLADMLSNQEVDLIVSTDPERYPSSQFVWVPLMDCRVMSAMSIRHPLADRRYLTISDLQGEEFVCNNIGISGDYIRNLFRDNGFTPPAILECNEHMMYTELMNDIYRVTIIPDYAVLESQVPDSIEIPLRGNHTLQHFGVVYRKDLLLTDEHQAFLDSSTLFCQELTEQTKALLIAKGILTPDT